MRYNTQSILIFSDFGHIKDVVGTTRLNRPSLKVTSPESPQKKKAAHQNAMQISGRIQVELLLIFSAVRVMFGKKFLYKYHNDVFVDDDDDAIDYDDNQLTN